MKIKYNNIITILCEYIHNLKKENKKNVNKDNLLID